MAHPSAWISVDGDGHHAEGWYAFLCLGQNGMGIIAGARFMSADGWGEELGVFAVSPESFESQDLAEDYAARNLPR
jgi:hypothetical protein